MLILTRKIGESIRIGDNVTVRVLALRGGQVSLGFTAPNEVRILREEIVESAPAERMAEVALAPQAKVRVAAAAVRTVAGRPG